MIDEMNNSLNRGDFSLPQKDIDKLSNLETELYKEGGNFWQMHQKCENFGETIIDAEGFERGTTDMVRNECDKCHYRW